MKEAAPAPPSQRLRLCILVESSPSSRTPPGTQVFPGGAWKQRFPGADPSAGGFSKLSSWACALVTQ